MRFRAIVRAAALSILAAVPACAPTPAPPVQPPPATVPMKVLQALQALDSEPPDVAASRAHLSDAQRHGEPDELVAAAEAVVTALSSRLDERVRLVAEVADLERRLEATERALLDIQRRFDETSTLSELLSDERARLTKRIDELEGAAASRTEKLRELERELEALKKIDMDRAP